MLCYVILSYTIKGITYHTMIQDNTYNYTTSIFEHEDNTNEIEYWIKILKTSPLTLHQIAS